MAKGTLDFENIQVEVNTFKKLIAIRVLYYKDAYDNQPECKEFVVDIKNDVLATGPMSKMILNVFNDKEEV